MSRSEFVHPISGNRSYVPKPTNDYNMSYYQQSSIHGYQSNQNQPNRTHQFRPAPMGAMNQMG